MPLNVSCCSYKGQGVPIPARRIRRIEYVHDGESFVAEVGKQADRAYGLGELQVVAIVGDNPTLVCAPTRGVEGGTPIFVGAEEIRRIEYFD